MFCSTKRASEDRGGRSAARRCGTVSGVFGSWSDRPRAVSAASGMREVSHESFDLTSSTVIFSGKSPTKTSFTHLSGKSRTKASLSHLDLHFFKEVSRERLDDAVVANEDQLRASLWTAQGTNFQLNLCLSAAAVSRWEGEEI